ncbi:glycosyltransferase family 4 protein [Candidatus Woesearchaeota archaeon]|nr:glycosyltransferase family 4 protein [Candidatus Woesearchaeota archaeon]
MKIAFVCPYYEPVVDGPKQVIIEIAKYLIKEGNEVHVYTSDWDKYKRIKVKEEVIDGVYVHRCFHILRVANFATVWPSVFFRLLKNDFDIIHTHVSGHAHVFFASLAAKLKNVKLVHTTHCPWTNANRGFIGSLLVKISYNTINKLSFKWSDKIIAITPWEIQFIEKYGGKGKIEVIPNGVSELFFEKVKTNNFKKNLGLKGKFVLFFGRLNVTKGVDNLMKVANEIVKERKEVNFLFIGPDEGMKDTLIKMNQNKERIKVLDAIKDRKKVREMYQSSEVYVLPSFREGNPLTLFEAFASGLPVVASPVNGIPFEMNSENGFLVEYGDLKNLKLKILKILDDEKLALNFSKNNRKKAEKYKWNDIAKKTEKLYKYLLK